jgi:hypothetical protein
VKCGKEHRHDQRGQQGGHRNQHGGLIRNQLHAIAGLAHRHVGCNRSHGQTDRDDDRPDHHRRQQAVDETGALDLHGQT